MRYKGAKAHPHVNRGDLPFFGGVVGEGPDPRGEPVSTTVSTERRKRTEKGGRTPTGERAVSLCRKRVSGGSGPFSEP